MNTSRVEVRRAFALAALRLSALFAVVFYGADELAALRSYRWPIHFSWEDSIPYWPVFYMPYLSVFAVPFLAMRLHTADAVRCWERRMALVVLTSGVVFVAFPAELGYSYREGGVWQPLADLTRLVSGHFNLLPSLHVALTFVTMAAVWRGAGVVGRVLLALWCGLLMASTLLTHQHHLADVVAGAVLAWAVARWPKVRLHQ